MKYLGIDWGTKYIGLAITDDECKFSFPYKIVENKGESYVESEISKVVIKEGITKIVVGLPSKLSGEKSYAVKKVENFVQTLQHNPAFEKIEFAFFDERLTTKLVEKELLSVRKKRKNKKTIINKACAQRILQDYLDSLKS